MFWESAKSKQQISIHNQQSSTLPNRNKIAKRRGKHNWNTLSACLRFWHVCCFLTTGDEHWFSNGTNFANKLPTTPGSPNAPKQLTVCCNNRFAISTAMLGRNVVEHQNKLWRRNLHPFPMAKCWATQSFNHTLFWTFTFAKSNRHQPSNYLSCKIEW